MTRAVKALSEACVGCLNVVEGRCKIFKPPIARPGAHRVCHPPAWLAEKRLPTVEEDFAKESFTPAPGGKTPSSRGHTSSISGGGVPQVGDLPAAPPKELDMEGMAVLCRCGEAVPVFDEDGEWNNGRFAAEFACPGCGSDLVIRYTPSE